MAVSGTKWDEERSEMNGEKKQYNKKITNRMKDN